MVNRILFLVIYFSVCSAAVAQRGTSELRLQEWRTLTDVQAAEIVSSELSRCPCWDQFDADEVEIRAGIVKICSRLSIFSDTALKDGVRLYWEQFCVNSCETRYRNAAKVYLLPRVIFDVPERVAATDIPDTELVALGQYVVKVEHHEINMLWPLEKSADGSPILKGWEDAFAPSHAPYNGISDFNFIISHFSRRAETVSKKTNAKNQ